MSPERPVFSSPAKKKCAAPVTNLDDFDQRVLRRTVLIFYEWHEIPTLDKILEEFKATASFSGSRTSLRKILLQIGFRFAKVDGHKFLMERNDVVAAHMKFLQERKQVKQSSHHIVYLDSWKTLDRHYIPTSQWSATDDRKRKSSNYSSCWNKRWLC